MMKAGVYLKLLFLAVVLGGALYGWFEKQVTATGKTGPGEIVVQIEKGSSLRSVAQKLSSAGVIGNPVLFEIEARLTGNTGALKAGEYRFSKDSSIRSAVQKLARGETLLHSVTVPEGLTIFEIAELLEKNGLADSAEFVKAGRDKGLIDHYRIPADSLEGYLFPETYMFRKGVPEKEIANTMTKLFFEKVKKLPPSSTENRDELHKMVTMASLVEKETSVAKERKLVASVFYNRLKRKMLLQCDPTVIYSLPDFDGNITKKDLLNKSPYNTYVHRGLPPGPIANPGFLSLLAVAEPADTKYLYFVAKKENGEHHFSLTLAEHNRAVRKYQLKRRRR